ncbi:MAG: outer membrane beta-barrel protein [Sulfuriferula multivorans]|uniref:Outer membrane beta-barrel protein n=1 Tax=Sulfuriferula multivorans TaxID=1559896 RepID=A0A7C9P9N7_9PROT|nr:outer membrane beta-barrel protein [Sulfuriferula multivorans]
MKTMHLMAAMVSALALSTSASAGFFDLTLAPYVGAGIGKSQADITCPTATSCDDKDTGYKIYGGLEVNEFMSMEFGYVDLGKTTYSGAKTGKRDTRGMSVQLVGTYALSPKFTLLGKGGFGILHTEVDGTVVASNSEADTDLEWSLGVGGQYNFTKNVGMRVEWERYFNVGDATTTGEADVDLITAGVIFKF